MKTISHYFILLTLTLSQFTWAETLDNQVSFDVAIEKEITPDLLVVNLYTQEEGKEISLLDKTVTQKMNTAITQIKQQSAVQIQAQNRQTQIRYNQDGKSNGWIVRSDIVVQSKDFSQLSKLATELNQTLMVEYITTRISPEKLSALENEMTELVLQKFMKKSLLIQSQFSSAGYKLLELNITTPNKINEYPRAIALYSAKSASDMPEDMQIEQGKTRIQVRAQGKIQLINH